MPTMDQQTRSETLQELRRLAAIHGATLHRSRLAPSGRLDAEIQLRTVRLEVSLGGPDACFGRFTIPPGTRWTDRFASDVGPTATGQPSLWLLWVALGLALAAEGEAMRFTD